jgi:hypothetical protein
MSYRFTDEPDVNSFGDCCGIQNSVFNVPDTILGVCISPACAIHDFEWETERREPNWHYFHASNNRFYANMDSLLINGSATQLTLGIRRAIASGYFSSVNHGIGPLHYWSCFGGVPECQHKEHAV